MAQKSVSLPSGEASILPQRKRKVDDVLVSGHSKTYIKSHKQVWEKTLRITNIPEEYNEQRLRQVLADILELEAGNNVKIHSLAFDAVDEKGLQYKVATVSFDTRPALLPGTSKDWDFELPNGDNDEPDDEREGQRIYIDEHFHVFTPLSPAEARETHTIDCIAIHGWGGHAFGSFRDPKSSHMWLRDSLPKCFRQLRLWIYGYESNLQDPDNIGGIHEYAENFRRHLRILRRKTKANQAPMPVIFLVHSLGGLIFKEAMIQMKDSDDPDDRLNFQSTYGALFFGVPSQGMDVGALAAMIGDLPQRYTLNLLDHQLGHRLKARQHEEFCKAFDYVDSKITQFFELKKSPTVRQDGESKWSRDGPRTLLVSPASASCGRPWETSDEYIIPLNGDHSTMVKFSENDRSDYPKVLDILESYINSAVPKIRSRMDKGKNQFKIRSRTPKEMTEAEKACQQSLFFEDMNQRMKDISDPVDKTCKWLSKHPNYLEWLNRQHGLLWIKGKPGAGKSTLVRHLLATDKQAKHEMVVASFFFHARGSVLQKSPLGLFRSLLYQILQQVPELLSTFSSAFEKMCETQGKIGEEWHWHERDLEDFFKTHVAGAMKAYRTRIYVDALDECGKAAASNLVGFFTRLITKVASTNGSLSICFSCRHYPDVALGNGLEVCVEDENHDDIKVYIQNTIENAVQDKKTVEVIRDEIVERSFGNFQWTVLVLSEVVTLYENGSSLKSIRRRIQAIPLELKELYQELLKGISDEDLPHSLRLIQWICFALRPLSLKELRFAAIIHADTPYRTISECENAEECDYAETDEQMKKRIRHLSRGLAEAKQHENIWIAQFIHQSVHDYFIQSGLQILDKHSSGNAIGRAHFQLSRSCIRYMAMKEISNLSRSFDTNLEFRFPLLQYAITSWISHVKEVEKTIMSQEDLLFFFHPPSSNLLQLWINMYDKIDSYSVERPFSKTTLIHVASRYCLSSVLSAVLNLNNVKADSRDERGRTPLSWAAANGHEAIVKLLIERDDVEADSRDQYGQTPLSWAAENGHEAVVKLLIERDDVKTDSRDRQDRTPLSWAAANGHEAVVKLLIERDDVKTDSRDRQDRTPLSWAARFGHEAIVKLLIERDDVEADSKDRDNRTPLSWAAENGHETVVKLLQSVSQKR